MSSSATRAALAAAALLLAAQPAAAQAIRTDAGFTANVSERNDDWSWDATLPFTATWDGLTTTTLGINNNGYVGFGTANLGIRPCEGNEPGGFATTCGGRAFLGFNADLDTRNENTSPVTWGLSTVGGRQAYGVNYRNIGFYPYGGPALDFQIVVIDRNDVGAGDFDVEFNYGDMASGYARGGWVSTGASGAMPESGTGSFGGSVANSRYTFSVRGGVASGLTAANVSTVPEPGTWALMGTGLAGLAAVARRRRAR